MQDLFAVDFWRKHGYNMASEVAFMKRVTKIFLTALVTSALLVPTVWAQGTPTNAPFPQRGPELSKVQAQQRMFYGYVPPAPIKHTWPGGYRNIWHELTNTLIEHMLGRY